MGGERRAKSGGRSSGRVRACTHQSIAPPRKIGACEHAPCALDPPPSALDHSRRGLSLLEVLISVFILLFGLLAVAAVIPLAGLRIIQIGNADRSAACGAAATKEVKIRRMLELDAVQIRMDDPSPPAWPDRPARIPDVRDTPPTPPVLDADDPFVIDPLFVAETVGVVPSVVDDPVVGRLTIFPYFPVNLAVNHPGASAALPRFTLRVSPYGPTPPPPQPETMQLALAERIFTWQDDLNIPVPEDDAQRPRQMMIDETGAAVVYPPLPGQAAPGNLLTSQIEGRYSWMATVTPLSGNRYEVAVVVFYNRDFSPPGTMTNPEVPGERIACVRFFGAGLGGGDVALCSYTTEDFNADGTPDPWEDYNGNGVNPEPIAPEYLDIRAGQWLMLAKGNTFHWYRVVATAETYRGDEDLNNDGNLDVFYEDTNNNGVLDPSENDGVNDDADGRLDELEDFNGNGGSPDPLWVREVTLAGVDWTESRDNVWAVICTGVIGVYTTTIEVD